MKTATVIVLLLLAAGGFLGWQVFVPYHGFAGERFVDIPHGTSTGGVAALLTKAGVVRGLSLIHI